MVWACRNKKMQCVKSLLKDRRTGFPITGMRFIFDLEFSDVLEAVYRDLRFNACKRFFDAGVLIIQNVDFPNEKLQSVLLEHLMSYKDVDTKMLCVWGIRYAFKYRRILLMKVLMQYTNPSIDNNYLITAACHQDTFVVRRDSCDANIVSDQKKIILTLLDDDRVLSALTPEHKRLLQSINMAPL